MNYALVTGASRGIGRSISKRLAKDGFCVLLNYCSNHAAAQETLSEIEAEGGHAELLPFDVSNEASMDEALEKWAAAHPDDYISVLVNNAGIRMDNLMVFMQDEQWHKVIDTSLNGFFYVTRRLVKQMMTHRYGRIVNVTSLSGLKGLPGQTNYSASGSAKSYRERCCSWIHCYRYDKGLERGRPQEDDSCRTLRKARGSGFAGVVLGFGRVVLYHGRGYFN